MMDYENIDEILPLKKAKELLEANGNKYTLEEARIIREWLFELLKTHIPQLLNKTEVSSYYTGID